MGSAEDIGICITGGQFAYIVFQTDPEFGWEMVEHVVFANSSEDAAFALTSGKFYRFGTVLSPIREPLFDRHSATGVPDSFFRSEGWATDLFDPYCDECGLFEWPSVPESKVPLYGNVNGARAICLFCDEKNHV